MPKKRQNQALRIKPGDGANSSASPQQQQQQQARPSVNDLIRESRRLQFQQEGGSSTLATLTTTTTTGSVPPQVRQALDLPAPAEPVPRAGSVARHQHQHQHHHHVVAGQRRSQGSGPGATRARRVPGPPPPRSWLTSTAATTANRHYYDSDHQRTIRKTATPLPGLSWSPRPGSLYDLTLKELARHWNWHAEYYGEWLGEELPVRTREALLSYIAMYSTERPRPSPSPLRLLFMADLAEESRAEVTRLDLTSAIGGWITVRQLQKELSPVATTTTTSSTVVKNEPDTEAQIPDAWDEGPDTEAAQLQRLPPGPMFKNLQHLSLALSPGQQTSAAAASWKDLIHLAGKVSTITSLSLAFWPLPTYTPRAASTRVVVPSATPRPQVVYGGTNMYSPFDNDWRESAGILRSLSRALYCLKWLDLTGCAPWFPALTWTGEEGEDHVMPDWNGWWRGVQHVTLAVGWEPVERHAKSDDNDNDLAYTRQMYAYNELRIEHETFAGTAKTVAEQLKAIRRLEGGKWIDFAF